MILPCLVCCFLFAFYLLLLVVKLFVMKSGDNVVIAVLILVKTSNYCRLDVAY